MRSKEACWSTPAMNSKQGTLFSVPSYQVEKWCQYEKRKSQQQDVKTMDDLQWWSWITINSKPEQENIFQYLRMTWCNSDMHIVYTVVGLRASSQIHLNQKPVFHPQILQLKWPRKASLLTQSKLETGKWNERTKAGDFWCDVYAKCVQAYLSQKNPRGEANPPLPRKSGSLRCSHVRRTNLRQIRGQATSTSLNSMFESKGEMSPTIHHRSAAQKFLHPWRLTAGTCPKMEVWFRSFSLNKMGDGCRFQPLIFQGVPQPPERSAGTGIGTACNNLSTARSFLWWDDSGCPGIR